MSDYKKNKLFEEQFKKRYNRDIQVYVSKQRIESVGIIKVKIISPKGKEYKLTEITENGGTIATYITLKKKDPKDGVEKDFTYKYVEYLHAEIMCADAIGEE